MWASRWNERFKSTFYKFGFYITKIRWDSGSSAQDIVRFRIWYTAPRLIQLPLGIDPTQDSDPVDAFEEVRIFTQHAFTAIQLMPRMFEQPLQPLLVNLEIDCPEYCIVCKIYKKDLFGAASDIQSEQLPYTPSL